MPASKGWIEETAKEIIGEFEDLLCNNDIKINNKNPQENNFENEYSYINQKDYEILKQKVIKQLNDLQDYIYYEMNDAA